MMGANRTVRGSDSGAAMVEFAILLPVFLLTIAGIVDFGRAFFTQIQLTNAAREGARAAVVSTAAPGDIQSRAKIAYAGSLPAPVDLTVTIDQTCPGTNARVTASYAFTWIALGPAMNLIGGGSALPATLSSSAVMKCGG